MSRSRTGQKAYAVRRDKSAVKRITALFNGFREGTLLLTIFIISVVMSYLSPAYLTAGNIITTIFGFSIQGIVVVGMTLALISRGIDLSVGSVVGLTGVVAGSLFLKGMNIWLAIPIAFAVSLLCGCINGLFITRVGLNPFIMTLVMMGIGRGMSYVLTRGTPLPLQSLPQSFKVIGTGSLLGIPYIILIFALITLVGDYLIRRSTLFRQVFYVGSNETAAIYSGINTDLVKFGVYTFTGALAGIAGILSLARFGVATPTFGTGLEMSVISAAVIGGASLNGGEGTVLGAVLGVVLLGIINSSLILLGVSVYWQQLISSVILLAAVSSDYMFQVRKKMRFLKMGDKNRETGDKP